MKARVVSFHYTLTNTTGEVLDSSSGAEPLTYMEGAEQIIPGLEEQMKALSVGDKKKILVPAADAYGVQDPALVVETSSSSLPKKNAQVGDQFTGALPNGQEAPFTVTKVTDSQVTLDGNHPLAGQDLTFDVELTEIREATAEELEHGHAHGPDGHHHH